MFQGLKRFSARKIILDDLKSKGLYIKTEDNPMVIPICRLVSPVKLDLCVKYTVKVLAHFLFYF